MNSYSPLLGVFAYNRPSHFKRLLISLENFKIDQIILFIDGPKNQVDKVNQLYIVNMAKTSRLNFKIIKRKKNLGLKQSLLNGIDYMAKNSNFFTILEDDIVIYENFFKFHYKNLIKYKNKKNIFSICGFQFKNLEKNYKFLSSLQIKYFIPWGWSCWSDKWKNLRKSNSHLNFETPLYLKNKLKLNNNNYWSLDLINYCKRNNFEFIYPTVSLLKNIGFDGSGVNSKVSSSFIMSEKKVSSAKDVTLINYKEKKINQLFYANLKKYAELFY